MCRPSAKDDVRFITLRCSLYIYHHISMQECCRTEKPYHLSKNIGLEWIALTCSISIRKSRWFGFLLRQSVAAIDSREFSHWGHRAEMSWTCQWFKWFDILRHSQLFGKGFSELLSTSLCAVYCCLSCFNNICRPSNWDCVLVYIERSFEFAISNMFYCWTVLVVHWRPQSLSLRAGLMHSPARL